ncbi:MAG: hypothetical protein JSV27_05160 [Candidatus Bathyarchaeota archaeon]|nr:MAG: hypothetical protein JSV27_05160 [Candidatus Bathyarchaeota archaeon]
MRTYIKIYGPPILKSLKVLEKIAIDMPEVCIMDTLIVSGLPDVGSGRLGHQEDVSEYFSGIGEITKERCDTIISKSSSTLGEYDFFFEWFTGPTMDQLDMLTEKIDEALAPLGCKYTMTTV